MANIFATEDSVFFIGGTGQKFGLAEYGGCTKEFFDNNGGEESFALSTIMGADGAAKIDESQCHYDHEGAAEGDHKIYKNNAGEFADAAVGMVAYISGTNITLGRYKITGVDSANGNYVLVAGIVATGDNDNTVIKIGGAISNVETALGAGSLDATAFNVYVYDNLGETQPNALDVSVEGSTANGTHLYVKGFNTTPGDMDYGGSYYQGPLSADNDGVDTDKCVEIDGDGGDYYLLDLTDMECIHFCNFYLHNTGNLKGLTLYGLEIEFSNCKFNSSRCAVKNGDSITLVNCWLGNSFTLATLYPYDNFALINSFVNIPSGLSGIAGMHGASLIIGNIFVGGNIGVDNQHAFALLSRNTFYNQTGNCIYLRHTACLVEFNNIFMPADENDYAVKSNILDSYTGVVLYSDFSLAYNVAGNNFANPPWYDDYNDRDLQGPNSLKDVDPQFVDAANGDFRPRSPDAIRKGKPDIHGNAACMGAVLEPADKVIRAAMANLGRLKIFR